MRTLLSIAGFDPSSGAGVTADLAVFAAHGAFGTSCLTALTVQSTVGVRSVEPVDSRILRETLACLCEDLPPAAIKLGMLATVENVRVVVEFLQVWRSSSRKLPVVLDPVIRSSSGRELLTRQGVDLMRDELLPLVTLVTPNLDELGVLTGTASGSRAEVEEAARSLQRQTPGLGVVVTGGHFATEADDLVLAPDSRAEWLPGAKIASQSTHGTGCAFSSALACRLAEGFSGVEAARLAKEYVAEGIRRATPLGRGHGPLRLLWPLDSEQDK